MKNFQAEGKEPPEIINRVKTITWNMWNNNPTPVQELTFPVAGVTFNNSDGVSRQKILAHLKRLETIDLIREPLNKHDEKAIAVCCGMGQVGYVPRRISYYLAPIMDAGIEVLARTGTEPKRNEAGKYQVLLDVHINLPEGTDSFIVKVVGLNRKSVSTETPRKEILEERRDNLFKGSFIFFEKNEDEDYGEECDILVSFDEDQDFGQLGKKDVKKILPLIDSGRQALGFLESVSSAGVYINVFVLP